MQTVTPTLMTIRTIYSERVRIYEFERCRETIQNFQHKFILRLNFVPTISTRNVRKHVRKFAWFVKCVAVFMTWDGISPEEQLISTPRNPHFCESPRKFRHLIRRYRVRSYMRTTVENEKIAIVCRSPKIIAMFALTFNQVVVANICHIQTPIA